MAAPTFALFGSPTLSGSGAVAGNYTTSGGKRIVFLVLAVAAAATAPSVFTLGGVTATLVAGSYVQITAGQQFRVYEIPAASAPAAGSNALVVTFASATTVAVIAGEVTGDATGYAEVDSGTTTGTTANVVNVASDVADCLGIAFAVRGGTPTDFAWSTPSGVSELIGPAGSGALLGGIAVATLPTATSYAFSTTRTGGTSTNGQVVLVLRPAAGGTEAVTLDAITTGAPVVTQMALGQVHALTLGAIATAAPGITQLALGQIHGLGLGAISTPAPSISQLSLGQVHSLGLGALTAGQPTVSQLTLGQVHAIGLAPITTAAPAITQMALGQVYLMNLDAITTGAPLISQMALNGMAAPRMSEPFVSLQIDRVTCTLRIAPFPTVRLTRQ